MIELTQTSLYPAGNCWQTCVASILEVGPEALPSQADIERIPPGEKYGSHYHNALNAYLRRHHGLLYSSIQVHQVAAFDGVRAPGWHCLEGRTVRSPETGQDHVVVARDGEMVWDPHPSRAGLTKVLRWGVLVAFPEDIWGETWDRIPCVCPACAAEPR